MPITKTYLNKKTVAQVRGLATTRSIPVVKKTKAQLVTAILKYEAKKKKAKKVVKPKYVFAYKQNTQGGRLYVLAVKPLKPGGKTRIKATGIQSVNKYKKMAKEGTAKKVPFNTVMIKTYK